MDAILKENSKDLDGKYLKGRIALAERRLEESQDAFRVCGEERCGMAKARLYNGLTEVAQGYIETGKKEVMEAVKLEPGNVRARLVLGDLYLKSNAPLAAEKEAIEVLRKDPSISWPQCCTRIRTSFARTGRRRTGLCGDDEAGAEESARFL